MSNPQDLPALDLTQYTRSPVCSLPEGVALARALIDCAPKDLSALEKRWIAQIKQSAEAAQAALVSRQREENQLDDDLPAATIDNMMDLALSGLRGCLEAVASLPDSYTPKAARARKLLAILFGDGGLLFLKLSYAEEWSHISTLLARIKADGLQAEIDALCGPEFLGFIKLHLPRYERMVSAQLQRSEAPGENLTTHRLTLTRKIVGYASALCAALDDSDAASIRRLEDALRPIRAQRALSDRRAAGSTPTPPTPTPAPTPS
jgi:hypothetical protein